MYYDNNTGITYTLFDGSQFTNANKIEIGNADITECLVNGIQLSEELDNIKSQLLLLSRDIDMEKKYPELKEAYDNYNSILKQLKIVEVINDDN